MHSSMECDELQPQMLIDVECGDLAPPLTGGPDRPLRGAEVSDSETSGRESGLASESGVGPPHSTS
ncbi:hypothetical protein GALL_161430 [mine drainage metagenome]|uniref:Uncharacterized protein n=1 Tax=mine drainage metagenome TaxID=410659 RepID=A0A1J5S0C5_9ZZZZ